MNKLSFEEDLNQAIQNHKNGDLKKAEKIYLKILEKLPTHENSLALLGSLYIQTKQFSKAIIFLSKSYKLNPNNVQVIQNLSIAYREKGSFDKSLDLINKALLINNNFYTLFFHKAILLSKKNDLIGSLENFFKFIKFNQNNAFAFLNIANIKMKLKQYSDALIFFNKALKIDPKYEQALGNKGYCLFKFGKFKESIDCLEKAIKQNDNNPIYFHNLGFAQREIGNAEIALKYFKKAEILQPKEEIHFYEKYITFAYINDYENLKKYEEKFLNIINVSKNGFNPFTLLFLTDSASLQLNNAKKYVNNIFKNQIIYQKKISENIINLGFISADFRNHPISRLIIDLLKNINRKKFNVIGFSLQKSNDILQKDIERSFDFFYDISNLSDENIVEIIRKKQIDIGFDLGGYANNSRLSIFHSRIAPIQISYLGFLGTTGARFIDYIIADEVLIQKNMKKYYTEKIIFLPHYQSNSINKKIGNCEYTKENLGFPKNYFVFCCFNNNFKISELNISMWINILKKVPKSILYILIKNKCQRSFLLNIFIKNSIESNRIFFAEQVSHEKYLARFNVVDIFLDTYPYNAGTIASDALFTKTPVITLKGPTFSSSICASVLKAANLEELICYSTTDYENLAIRLATNKKSWYDLLNKIENIHSSNLFNIKKFTENFEYGLLESINNYNNKKFENIIIN